MVGFKKMGKNKGGPMTARTPQGRNDSMTPTQKKGFNSSMKTPNTGKNAKDMHVSFQVPKDSPPSTFKGKHPPTPMPRKKDISVLSAKKQKMAEFKGMKDSPAKQSFASKKPNKGQGSAMQKFLDNLSDDDDDDDDENDSDVEEDDEDDSVDEEEIKSKIQALKQKQMQSSKKGKTEDDDDEEDDDDDDDEEEDDDDNEGDLRQKLDQLKQKLKPGNVLSTKQKTDTSKGKIAAKDEDSDDDMESASDSEEADKQVSPQKKQNAAQQKVKQDNSAKLNQSADFVSKSDGIRNKERDARKLFLRGLPFDVTVEEIKSLSPDIIDCYIPSRQRMKKNRPQKFIFAFVAFANEKKTEENHAMLQNKKLRGKEFFVDFCGEKSSSYRDRLQKQTESSSPKKFDKKKLTILDLPIGTTIVHLANLFPKASCIALNYSIDFRNAYVTFKTESDAEEAMKKNEKAKIEGKPVTVLFTVIRDKGMKKRKHNTMSSLPVKKPRLEIKNEAEEDEDDDDDDDDGDDSD